MAYLAYFFQLTAGGLAQGSPYRVYPGSLPMVGIWSYWAWSYPFYPCLTLPHAPIFGNWPTASWSPPAQDVGWVGWWRYAAGDACTILGLRPLVAAAKVWPVVSGWTIIGGWLLLVVVRPLRHRRDWGSAQVPLWQCHLVERGWHWLVGITG